MAGNSPLEHHAPPRSFASFFQKPADVASNKTSLIKQVKFINGTPTLEFEDDEFEQLIAPHRLCLVGKFSYGGPKMEEIHNEFRKIRFNGGYTLGLMNPRHVLIRFKQEEDYQRCWIQTFWNIGGFSMRMLKWKPGFRFEEDPPVVPICVAVYDLPIEFMHPEVIYSMAIALGQPLKVDTPTMNMTRPSMARFCVEVDLTKELPKSVKIGKKGRKHEQIFTFEHIPSYCLKCSQIGHKEADCRVWKPLQSKMDGDTNMNPLIVKGFESQNVTGKDEPPGDETLARLGARPMEETLAAETLAAEEPRQTESTSRLSTIKKGAILVDLQSTPVREEAVSDLPKSNATAPVQSENRFSVLQEQVVANINDDVENILIEDINQERQNVGTENIESVIVTESHVDISSSMLALEMWNLSPAPKFGPIHFPDDSFAAETMTVTAIRKSVSCGLKAKYMKTVLWKTIRVNVQLRKNVDDNRSLSVLNKLKVPS
ncbi:OLC1v1018976C1 [Oldenlandia corymbosa var. corymbosa]|uniref:OLC1v1018976C1 n=1 Tax=Oldenlandia corymbosa var. corymbosa TaxID=529605 RepID=A0AAV1EDB5_OLDCO|nr:OLC1v1018976C1 [Oldenlandia corymbosa var. corymbosa]